MRGRARRTATRPRRSRSARSPAAGSRSCRGTAPDHEYPPHRINYRANLWALRSARRPPGAGAVRGRRAAAERRARRPRGARPARRPDLRAAPAVVRRDRRGAPAVRRPVLRPAARRALGAEAGVTTGGTMVVDRGPAVLHPRRVAALRRAGLDADQHDRRPRGRAGPRDAARATPRSRWSPTWTPASRSGEGVGQAEVFALFERNIERLTATAAPASSATCPTRTAAPARPGPTASSSPTSCP